MDVAYRHARDRSTVKVVIGLGNPGQQYERTRHNVGWLVLDTIAERAGLTGRHKARDAAVTVRGRHMGTDLVLVKPTTYMNDSGIAVRKVLAREHVKLEDVLIVVDDFDLPFGKLRMRAEGSAGTHNGLRSIVAEMGTQKWARLRIGIGVGSDGHGGSARQHVLTSFSAEEERQLPTLLDAAADAVEVWATDGSARAADRFNAWRLPPPDAQPTQPGAGSTASAPADGTAQPDATGIVRTRTGWRKLLGGGS
jgi:PTH1 family peptidyl-tRNA hydrolase